jgi:5-methylcytosine-specific restriction endonuclease McrA
MSYWYKPRSKKFHINKSTAHRRFLTKQLIGKYGNKCQICGKELSRGEITIDHIVPLSKGGSDEFSNCQIACFECNQLKGDNI